MISSKVIIILMCSVFALSRCSYKEHPDNQTYREELPAESFSTNPKDNENILALSSNPSYDEEKVSSTDVEITKNKDVMEAYQQFLDGEITVDDINIDTLSIPTGEPERRYGTYYAYQDSDGDGVPELHINSSRYYTVLSYKNNELYVWTSFMPYPYYTGLNDGAFMSYDSRVYMMYYRYFILNYSGETVFEVIFSKEAKDGNGILDQYVFDGVTVTKEIWEELTERYLYVDVDGIERIRNEIEWTVLFEGTK